MSRKGRALGALVTVMVLMLTSVGSALSHPGQHGPTDGHLLGTGAWGKIEFVSKLIVPDAEDDLIADLAVYGNYAYLARWGGSECAGPEGNGPDGGVYIIDISNLSNPRQVGFIRTHQDTLVGEGMQVIHIDTPRFTGDVLAINHEGCGKNYKAGFSLWDVTDPLKPKKLTENFGDFTVDGEKKTPHDANQYHSVFIWDAGDRAYLVATDDEETADVDVFDITDPKKPVLIGEYDLNERFGVLQDQATPFGAASFLHDMVVKQIGNRWVMLLSYWDGGWVVLDVTDPANPTLVADYDYPAVDPFFGVSPMEGNAHQAEWTIDNRFIIGTDEDFDPYARAKLRIASGPNVGQEYIGGQGGANPVMTTPLAGPTYYVGRACDPATVPAAPSTFAIALIERGDCLFTDKAANVTAQGYDAAIVFNSNSPVAFQPCEGVFQPSVESTIPFVLVPRSAGYALLGIPYDPVTCLTAPNPALPPIGTQGATANLSGIFEGWGYVHLIDAATMKDVDFYAIPQARDPAFASGFGDLSVHEVAVDPQDASLAYLSYYAGGLRAVQIQCTDPAVTSTCRLVEVGGYLDPEGNDFWGVETIVRNGQTYILASDRDSGLWIFRDP